MHIGSMGRMGCLRIFFNVIFLEVAVSAEMATNQDGRRLASGEPAIAITAPSASSPPPGIERLFAVQCLNSCQTRP